MLEKRIKNIRFQITNNKYGDWVLFELKLFHKWDNKCFTILMITIWKLSIGIYWAK